MFILMLSLMAADITVAPSGGDFSTVQAGLNAAQAGDTVWVATGTYNEQIIFPRSGNAVDGAITLRAMSGQTPVLDGTGFVGGIMVLLENRSWINFRGFEIRNLSQINDGSAIRVLGSGDQIELSDHHIHNMRGEDAMGITVYATQVTPISNIRILRNWIHDCEPARSEALTLNGNVDGFEVDDNIVTDVNNIAIDFIGGETDINPNAALVTRNGVCRGNFVARSRANYGGGFAGAIYVDGGRNIIIEANEITQSDLGMEIGAENAGTTTEFITVRNNWVYSNDKVGLVFGGFEASVGRVENCLFTNNTFYRNDTLAEGFGELWIQFASHNRVENNIFYGQPDATIHYSEGGNTSNSLDYNLWYANGTPIWEWQSQSYSSFAAFQTGSQQDGNGLFADPMLVDPSQGDGHLRATSPAINRGDPNTMPAEVGMFDFDGQNRQIGRIDIGMDERMTSPTCLPELYVSWLEPTNLCNQIELNVLGLTAILNQTCPCP